MNGLLTFPPYIITTRRCRRVSYTLRLFRQVTQLNALVNEIAASAQEQATGLNEVNTAVNQMDQVTQQNAAMVEQATAASHSLASETSELARLLEQFQTNQTIQAQAVTPPSHKPQAVQPASKPRIPMHASVGKFLVVPRIFLIEAHRLYRTIPGSV